MSGKMAQKQMESLENMEPLQMPCSVCDEKLTSWDHHLQCIHCRSCNKAHPCAICTPWSKNLWTRLRREIREANRGIGLSDHQDSSDATPRTSQAPTKRAATQLSPHGDAESGPSVSKSPKRDGGGSSTWDWERLVAMVGTTVQKTVTGIQQQNAADMSSVQARMDTMAEFIQTRRTGKKSVKKGKHLATSPVQGPSTPVAPTLPGSHTAPAPMPMATLKASDETLDMSGISEDEAIPNEDLSNEDSDSGDNHSMIATDGVYEKKLVHVLTHFGFLAIKHSMDIDGCISIEIPDRLSAIAKLAGVKPIKQVSDIKPMQTFKCLLSKAPVIVSDKLLLPQSPLLESATNALVEAVASVKTTNLNVLPKAPKNPTVAITDDWWEPAIPSPDFGNLGVLPSQDELSKATHPVKMTTLAEWERATRQLMTALSYSHYTNTAMCELVRSMTHPDQHLESVQALASSFLVSDVDFQCTLLTNAAFLLGSINLVRKDYFLKFLATRTKQVPKLIRMLRFAPLSSDSIFGEAETSAIQLLSSHDERQANSNLAKSRNSKANIGSSDRSRSRSKNRTDKHKRSRSTSKARKENLQVDLPQPQATRQVSFKETQAKQPFRGGRRGRGRGGGRGTSA